MTTALARMRQIVGSTADWAGHDLVLGAGELALERLGDGSVRARVGDGAAPFSAAPYLTTSTAALRWKGVTDPTAAPPAGAISGDMWSASPGGVVDASWGPPAAGQAVAEGDFLILSDGGDWYVQPGGIDVSGLVTDAELGAAGGAAMVGFQQEGAGAVVRTMLSKARDAWDVKDFGASGDPADLGQWEAIQRGIDALADDGGGTLEFSHGDYTINPEEEAAGYIGDPTFGETLVYGLRLRSGVRLQGRGGRLRMADGISTRALPQNFAMFYTEEALTDLGFVGLDIDLNASNNWFSPDPANTSLPMHQRYLRCHQAAIFVEGAGGRADRVLIEGNHFHNGGGVSTIIMGRTPTPGLGADWRVLQNLFRNLGLDTYDHSSIFAWADAVTIAGNTWRNDLIYASTAANRTGINAAIETHGSDTLVTGNLFVNCNRAAFLTENSVARVERVIFAGNVTKNAKYCGVDLAFDGSGGVGGPSDILIQGNIFGLSSDDTNLDGAAAAGSVLPGAIIAQGLPDHLGVQHYAPITHLTIAGNRARRPPSPSGRASNFVSISLQANGFNDIVIRDNSAVGFTRGELFVADVNTVAGDITSTHNDFQDPEGGSLGGVTKLGTLLQVFGGTMGRFFFEDRVVDTRGSCAWALGVASIASGAPTVREVAFGPGAVFDSRIAYASRIDLGTLPVTRKIRVPVAGTYPAGNIAGGGVGSVNVTMPGVQSTDRLEVTGFTPANADTFTWSPRYSAANTARLRMNNDTSAGADPGASPFFMLNLGPA